MSRTGASAEFSYASGEAGRPERLGTPAPAARPTALSPAASAHLNMLRGVCALAVVSGHVRGLFFKDLSESSGHGVGGYALYAATALGHEAVMVFFVLSGFFIAGSALHAASEGSWGAYLTNRLTRLYLVLLPALVLTACADQIGLRLPNAPIYYLRSIPHFNQDPLVLGTSVRAFIGNALFLQTIVVPTFGSNSPLWSLANEFWYYMLFPLAVISWRNGRLSGRLLSAAVLLTLGVLLPVGIVQGFLVWLLGAAVGALPRPAVRTSTALSAVGLALSCFVAALAIGHMKLVPDAVGDLLIGVTCAVWIYCLLLKSRSSTVAPAYKWIAATLAGCSYSVYATHFPLVLLIRTWAPSGRWELAAGTLVEGGLIALAVVGAGWLFSRATEANTDAVRAQVSKRFGLNRTAIATGALGRSY